MTVLCTPSWVTPDPRWITVLDTETTGLPDDPTAQVIEVAAAHLCIHPDRSISIWDTWETLVCPVDDLTEDHLEICRTYSKITPDEILSAPAPHEALALLCRKMRLYPGPIIAWNVAFDRRMVRRTLLGICEEQYHNDRIDPKYGAPTWLPVMGDPLPWGGCLAQHYTGVKGPVAGHFDAGGGEPKPRVASLGLAMTLERISRHGQAHRALSDVLATAELAMKLWRGEVQPWGSHRSECDDRR